MALDTPPACAAWSRNATTQLSSEGGGCDVSRRRVNTRPSEFASTDCGALSSMTFASAGKNVTSRSRVASPVAIRRVNASPNLVAVVANGFAVGVLAWVAANVALHFGCGWSVVVTATKTLSSVYSGMQISEQASQLA